MEIPVNKTFGDVTNQYANQPAAAGDGVNISEPQAEPQTEPPVAPEQPAAQPAAQPIAQPAAAAPAEAGIQPGSLLEIMQKYAQAQAENQQLKAALEQQSQAKEKQIEEVLVPPTLDFEKLQYADDAGRKSVQDKYAQDMAEYTAKVLDRKLGPVAEAVRQQKNQQADQAAYSSLKTRNPDVDKYLPSMNAIMTGNKEIASAMNGVSPSIRYALLYLAAKGSENIKPAQKTAEQTAEEVYSNPEVMRILEMKKASAVQNGNKVPPQMASSGITPTVPPYRPKTFDEVTKFYSSKV